jgi:hypothetical protein
VSEIEVVIRTEGAPFEFAGRRVGWVSFRRIEALTSPAKPFIKVDVIEIAFVTS